MMNEKVILLPVSDDSGLFPVSEAAETARRSAANLANVCRETAEFADEMFGDGKVMACHPKPVAFDENSVTDRFLKFLHDWF